MTLAERPRRVAWYVHHQGAGHRTRASSIARALAARGCDQLGFSSLDAPEDWPGTWVTLPRDDEISDIDAAAPSGPRPQPREGDAGGVLHWAPLAGSDLPGYADRMRLLAARLTEWAPDVLVSDVSVEVALQARLLGIPLVVSAMRGDRFDRPHVAAYDAASLLIAPWPGHLPEPGWPDRWTAKTAHVGGISRFDEVDTAADAASIGDVDSDAEGAEKPTVAVLWGRGGGDWPGDARAAARDATPGWRWQDAGADRPVEEALRSAAVVVTHGGQNAVAEVAALRKPAVVIALDRPHDEQHATARALASAELAVILDGPTSVADADVWPDLLDQAWRLGGAGWSRWSDGRGAVRAAAAIAALADGRRIAGGTAVVTLVRGRHDHLRGLLGGLGAGTVLPERTVVVTLGDEDAARLVEEWSGRGRLVGDAVRLPLGDDDPLPLAAARNAGVATAAALGCERVILLDVDCIPGSELVERYVGAMLDPADNRTHSNGIENTGSDDTRGTPDAGSHSGSSPTVWAGPVTYLPPRNGRSYDLADLPALRNPHAARPDPAPGERLLADDTRLFWSLSFAMTVADYRTLGGFHEGYVGYGGEDTDFGMTLAARGGRFIWLGGADAFHQYHPTSSPPVQHLDDILRNAAVFNRRWGWTPMEGWLHEFERLGLAVHDRETGEWSKAPGQEAR